MKKVILKIGGMSCSACAHTLEKYLNKQEGVISASVNLVMGEALITYEDNLKINDLNRFVKEAGYESLGEYNNKENNQKNRSKIYLFIMTFLCLILMYVSMASMLGLPMFDIKKYYVIYGIILIILTIPFIVYGFDIIKKGIKNIKHPSMDTLVTISILTSLIYSLVNYFLVLKGNLHLLHYLYFDSAAMVIYFVKLGRFIDSRENEEVKEAIKELVQITPQKAVVLKCGKEIEVTIDEVKKGDTLVVKPGMKVAVDGEIIKGVAHFDETFITGETKFKKKDVGDKVIAGGLNIDGYVLYEAERIGKNSTISEIVRLVMEATNTKAPIERIADKVSGIFAPSIILIAILTFIGYLVLGEPLSNAILHFATVLVVACPCALGLATPLALVVSEGKAVSRGILIKKSEALESASQIDTVVFDKTGTLTYGDLRIAKIYNYSKEDDEEVLKKIASLEVKITHPISNAFNNYATSHNLELLEVKDFKNTAGIGIEGTILNKNAVVGSKKILKNIKTTPKISKDEESLLKEGNTIIYFVEDNKLVAIIGLKDIVRSNALNVIKALQKEKKEVVMLTGDNEEAASLIAKTLGIKEVISSMMPKDKEEYIKALKDKGKKVLMVGDGINDAPSLTRANVGVSLSGSTEIATDAAHIILMDNNLDKLLEFLNISKSTFKIIKQNLFWAFFYNIVMVPIAMGLFSFMNLTISPMIASICMVLSNLTVVFNSLRLKR